MTFARALRISALFAMLTAPALAADVAPAQGQAGIAHGALPTLPLFELPEHASNGARQHVGLAHARRDSRRAQHTRAAPPSSPPHKPTQRHLAKARERHAAAQELRLAASERRFEGQERRANAALQRQAAAEQRAAERKAAAEVRGANAARK